MARFHVVRRCPLCVSFWLLGLDVRAGLLRQRGFGKHAKADNQQGSSLYQLGALTLHSSGLSLQLPEGKLEFSRRNYSFRLDGKYLPYAKGLELCRATIQEHETWVCKHCGTEYRNRQLVAGRLPKPVKRNVKTWRNYVGHPNELDNLRNVDNTETIHRPYPA